MEDQTQCTEPNNAYSHRTSENTYLGAYSHMNRYIHCSCMLHLEKPNEMQ